MCCDTFSIILMSKNTIFHPCLSGELLSCHTMGALSGFREMFYVPSVLRVLHAPQRFSIIQKPLFYTG